MWLNAQHFGNLLMRHAFKDRQPEYSPIALRQAVNELHNVLQRNASHVSLTFRHLQMHCFVQLYKSCLRQMVFIFRRYIPRYRHHPRLCLPVVAKLVERSEDNHKSIMQYVADGLLIADIASAYAPHPLGVCLV